MSSVSTTNISGTDPGTDHDFGRPSGTGVFLYRYPGTSYLATITLSLRDKIHSSAEALLKLTLMGRALARSGVARPVKLETAEILPSASSKARSENKPLRHATPDRAGARPYRVLSAERQARRFWLRPGCAVTIVTFVRVS